MSTPFRSLFPASRAFVDNFSPITYIPHVAHIVLHRLPLCDLATMTALSLFQKLDCLPALAALIGTILWALVTSPWRTHHYPSTLLLHVGYAAMRKATSRFSVAQLQYASAFSSIH